MTHSFLFTARNREGNKITEKVEAENLAQARYKLELQGYSAIEFYDSEIHSDILQTFDDKVIEREKNNRIGQNIAVQIQYDTRYWKTILSMLKIMGIPLIASLLAVIFSQNLFTYGFLGLSFVITAIICLPVFVMDKAFASYFNVENSKSRLWLNILKWTNKISLAKLHPFLIDSHLAKIDAREGKVNLALQQILKYQNDPKVSPRMINDQLSALYENAGDYDQMRKILEKTFEEGNVYQEEVFNYTHCLARRHKDTGLARQVLEKLYDFEITVANKPLLPLCKGMIELEDGNIQQAEIYLRLAQKELEPFKNNEYMVGIRNEMKALLSIVLAKTGNRKEALQLYQEAKNFLQAGKEEDLIRKCEEALG